MIPDDRDRERNRCDYRTKQDHIFRDQISDTKKLGESAQQAVAGRSDQNRKEGQEQASRTCKKANGRGPRSTALRNSPRNPAPILPRQVLSRSQLVRLFRAVAL